MAHGDHRQNAVHAHFVMLGLWGTRKHLVFECAQLAPLRAKYIDLFNDKDYTMRSFLCAAGPSEGVSLCRRLLKLDGEIVIAAVWHVRSASWLAKACETPLHGIRANPTRKKGS